MHRTTIHHWCRTIPQFREALESARQSRIDIVRDQMNELAPPSLAILKHTIEDESLPLALRIRTALAILKFVTTPEKVNTPKDAAAEMLMDAAYSAGHRAGCELAAESEPAIHHNSSLSSNCESDESQTPRNAPCPCGSKLKYKRCCGRNAPPVLYRRLV